MLAEQLRSKPINEIRFSELKHHYSYLKYDKGYSVATIELLNCVLSPVFKIAYRDGIIQTNPCDGCFHEVAKGQEWRRVRRHAIDDKTQKQFLEYVHHSCTYKHWENMFIFLFGTGMRVGEAIGIKWEDIDFKNKLIYVRRSISFRDHQYFEGPPKTSAGVRTIPMLKQVKQALLLEKKVAKLTKASFGDIKPGKSGFVFLARNGGPLYPSSINNAIKDIVNAYNKEHADTPMQRFSTHQIRHTFCRHLCENDVNLKVIQSVMGHSDISTTMDVYAEVSDSKKAKEFISLEGKIF